MSLRLKCYPTVKNSGVPWLGMVPEHWDLRSFGSMTSPVSERGRPDLPLLSVVREKGVILRGTMSDDENHNFVPDDLSNYKIARAGSLVINKMKAWQGSLGIAPCDGLVSPAYFVFDFRIADRRFGQALLRSKPYVALFARASDGVRIGQWDLSISGMKRIPVVVPPAAEQSAIVSFLDHADKRIRCFTAAKRRLIELLNEQKQAIIQKAVTRGLDANVRLKPSGIDLVDDIPDHWDVLPLTRCASELSDYRGATPEKVEFGVFLITAKNIRMGTIDYETSREYVRTDQYSKIMRRGLPRCGDILLTMEAPLGHVALVDREDVALAQRVIRLRMDLRAICSKFTLYSLMAPYFQSQLEARATGSTALGIKASKLPQLMVICPPVEEQRRIAAYLDKQILGLQNAIDGGQHEIDLLHEYRTRLIADVVTGKLDVREAARHLPAESEQLVPINTDDDLAEEVEVVEEEQTT
jgi:type I restriction enzyme, S subunit